MRLTVRVEDVGQSMSRNTDTVILNDDLEFVGRVDDLHDDAPPARRKTNRVGAEVDHKLVEPVWVADVGELRSVTLPLESDPCLIRLWVKLFNDAIHKRCEIERLPIDVYESRSGPRDVQDVFDELEKSFGALPDDFRQTLLTARQWAGIAAMKELHGATNRRQRRPQLVCDHRKEFLLRLLDLAQLPGHRVE
jgi:hypothetical protein